MFQTAYQFIGDTVAQGGEILFVGTREESQECVREESGEVRHAHMSTNARLGDTGPIFTTTKKSTNRLNDLDG